MFEKMFANGRPEQGQNDDDDDRDQYQDLGRIRRDPDPLHELIQHGCCSILPRRFMLMLNDVGSRVNANER